MEEDALIQRVLLVSLGNADQQGSVGGAPPLVTLESLAQVGGAS